VNLEFPSINSMTAFLGRSCTIGSEIIVLGLSAIFWMFPGTSEGLLIVFAVIVGWFWEGLAIP